MTDANRAPWDMLLTQARIMHEATPALQMFCPFPDDLTPKDVVAFKTPVTDLLAVETGLDTDRFSALRDAFVAAGPLAEWREPYKNADIGQDFTQRFGCYCLIGTGGAFDSDKMRAWMVYMPAAFYYTWHHHVAEEMYFVVGGSAIFNRRGDDPERLQSGQTCAHSSNQPHAMETTDGAVLCYVIWRNGFDDGLVLTDQAVAQTPQGEAEMHFNPAT
ncbi:dimethylsulfonioproprionate lyase family protein [Rhodobacteraceae bacterium KMM 6894]|nr:dimethylsulfonioproprionate lyase family protein [Rhodobacteraceae bacterium KMM 6894]